MTFLCAQAAEALDEDIDWWSKYYASTGQLDKCKQYLEHGYDKLEVKLFTIPSVTSICNNQQLK